jgi:flagellar hook-basal body complex protein FliE
MAANISDALSAYLAATKMSLGPATPSAGAQGGFGELMRQAAGNAIDTLKQGEQTSLNAVAGKASLADVAAAVTNAEVTLQTVVAVRDRVITAYQDIIKLTI